MMNTNVITYKLQILNKLQKICSVCLCSSVGMKLKCIIETLSMYNILYKGKKTECDVIFQGY